MTLETVRLNIEDMRPGDRIVNQSNGKRTGVLSLEPYGTWHFKMTLDNGMPATFVSKGCAYWVDRGG